MVLELRSLQKATKKRHYKHAKVKNSFAFEQSLMKKCSTTIHFAMGPVAVTPHSSTMPNLDFTFQQSQPKFPNGHPISELAAALPVVTLTSLLKSC